MADQSLRKYRQYIDCEMLLNRITEENGFMNILTPVSNAEEIRLFSELGANEFFSGYVNQKWNDDFNS